MSEELSNKRKRSIALGIFAAIVIVGFIVGYFYIDYRKTHISTDDAFIEGPIYTIAPRVSGTVARIYVSDNEFVQKGDIILELDSAVFTQRVRQAEAALNLEKERLSEIKAMITAQERKLSAMKAALQKTLMTQDELSAILRAREADEVAKESVWRQAKVDLERAENLFKNGAIAKVNLDRAKVSYDTALAALEAARASRQQAEVSLRSHKSVISQAEAALTAEEAVLDQLKTGLKIQQKQVERRKAGLKIAKLNLSYTKIYSPAEGYITKKSVEKGNTVRAGQPLMSVVPLDKVYVVANYKETKVRRIKTGQKVIIKVDAYPDSIFEGKVDSIMAGTGAAFSLFPPENATGNYVKVVQRIPVKIILDKSVDPSHLLRPGMSVVPTILVR
jgi:membrane fusion protein (multidrug efflux system)